MLESIWSNPINVISISLIKCTNGGIAVDDMNQLNYKCSALNTTRGTCGRWTWRTVFEGESIWIVVGWLVSRIGITSASVCCRIFQKHGQTAGALDWKGYRSARDLVQTINDGDNSENGIQ